jgi:anti-sigma regulatory factor (Ser/Thr protein kinase)
MSNDPARTELMLPDDERLLAAITPVVQHASQRCGLSTESQEGLAAAAIEAARETFPLMEGQAAGEPKVRVVVSDFPDRVEVAIEHRGEALPTAGLDTFVKDAVAGSGVGLSMALEATQVDRVQYETHDGVSRMTLIKYCDGSRTKAQSD